MDKDKKIDLNKTQKELDRLMEVAKTEGMDEAVDLIASVQDINVVLIGAVRSIIEMADLVQEENVRKVELTGNVLKVIGEQNKKIAAIENNVKRQKKKVVRRK